MLVEDRIYFDNAATTPIDAEVIEVMTTVLKEYYGNPSSIHSHGLVVRTIIEDARKSISKTLNCSPGEIFFTSGGTEADNMAIRKSVDCLGVKNVITSPIEHHAVLHTIDELEHKGSIQKHDVKLLSDGHINFEHLEELLQSNSNCLVSLMHINNEIGNMLDIEKVSELCIKYQAIFHSDTVQTIAHYPLDLQKTQIDFIACSAHKFNGPKGTGFIYINGKRNIDPFITGGAQERDMRGGTENVHGIAGMAKAFELSYKDLEKNHQTISEVKTYMIEQLKGAFSGVEFNGDAEGKSSYTILNASFPPTPIAEMLLFKLDISGVSSSGGSACTSGSNIGSHVLTALGVDSERPSVRFSFGKQNTKQEVDQVIKKLKEVLS